MHGKEEEKKEPIQLEETKELKPEDEKAHIKLLQVSKSEEQEIKNKIYNKVYEDFLQLYQGNQDRVKPLCQLLNITFNPEDPNESLRTIFRRVKNKLKTLIDFEGDLPIKEKLDIEELSLYSPYEEVSKEVQDRMVFLLEIKQSTDY